MAAVSGMDDTDRDLIVIHGCIAVLLGNVDVLRQIFADDEPKGRRISFIDTGNFLRRFGSNISISCNSHELFTPHQFIKCLKYVSQSGTGNAELFGTVFDGRPFRGHGTAYIYYIMSQL